MEFSQRLQKYREARRISQAELGEAIGSSGPSVHRWEKGVGGPTLRQAVEMARVLDVDLDQLAYDHPPDSASGLTDDERAILDLYHALEISRREALRRLAGSPGQATGPFEIDLPPSGGGTPGGTRRAK